MSDNGNWYDNPPCRDLYFIFDLDPDLARGISKEDRLLIGKAIEICNDCPVRQECLADAISFYEQEGIRAGLTPRQRQKLVPVTVKPWHARQEAAMASRRAEKEGKHGFGGVKWQNGCNCAECSYYPVEDRKAAAGARARQKANRKLSTGQK